MTTDAQTDAIRVFTDIDDARRAVIRRADLAETTLPANVQARIAQQWGEPLSAEAVVDRILARVQTEGDEALFALTAQIDGVRLDALEATRAAIESAYRSVPAHVVDAMRVAAQRVRAFHERQTRNGWVDFDHGYGQIVRPLDRVGVYAPGGAALYPSTAIMTAVPARVAGVREIVLVTPPNRDGMAPAITLVAADIAGVDRVFTIGGAQAIAALAFGTATVPRVDKILGPGNLFVALAKRKVFGRVAIDSIAGPTETLLIADESADPAECAADLLAQAEHDPLAQPILITTSRHVADATVTEIGRQLPRLPREPIARASVRDRGAIILVPSLAVAFDLANEYAPEHLCLLVREPWSWIGAVRNAGGVFVGRHSTEALGDYLVGPSHVMPTSGAARFSSPLNVDDFVKVISLIALRPEQARALGPTAITLAEAEGLHAHAESVRRRLSEAE